MTGTEVIGNNNNFVGWAAAALKWMMQAKGMPVGERKGGQLC